MGEHGGYGAGGCGGRDMCVDVESDDSSTTGVQCTRVCGTEQGAFKRKGTKTFLIHRGARWSGGGAVGSGVDPQTSR